MTRHKTSPYAARRRALTRQFAGLRIDALLVSCAANVRYLSGFTGEDSFLLAGPRWATLITDSRFAEQALLECPDIERHVRTGAMDAAIAESLRGRNIRRLGVESEHVSLAFHRKLIAMLGERRVRPVDSPATPLRITKDAAELKAIRRAVKIAQEAFMGLISPGAKAILGRTESHIAGELECRMRQLGASASSFPTIVAAGPHSALPHYRPGSTRIRPDQAVLFDWGAVADGYCSDLTRVVFTGRIPPQIGRIYEVVLAAQQQGINAARPGKTLAAVDAAARDIVSSSGFGEQFGHGLGHGIGLEIHEAPALSRRSSGRLRQGMVVTVEPGIYIPGLGGVRIEDDVLVEAGRPVVLSSLPKDMQAMILK